MSKNQRPLPQPLRFRQRRSGNLPRPVQLVNNFFSNPEVFFGARREDFSPAQKRELIPTPSRCQPLSSAFFKKLVRPAVPASRPCPAQRDIPSRSGENGLCTSTPPLSTTFYFFSDFFCPTLPVSTVFSLRLEHQKIVTLKFPLKSIRLCLQKAALSAFGQRKSPPQIRRRAFQAFWYPASYWIRTSTVVLLILTTLADTGARVNSNTRRVLSSWCPRRMPEIQRSLGTRGSWMPQLP